MLRLISKFGTRRYQTAWESMKPISVATFWSHCGMHVPQTSRVQGGNRREPERSLNGDENRVACQMIKNLLRFINSKPVLTAEAAIRLNLCFLVKWFMQTECL